MKLRLLGFLFLSTLVFSQNQTATKDLTLTISPAPLTISVTSIPSGTVGAVYPSTQLTVTGGVSPFTWTVCSLAPCQVNSLPTGMSLTSSGVLSGTPTVAFKGSITFKVVDNSGSIALIDLKFTPSVSPGVQSYLIKRGTTSGSEVQIAQLGPTTNSYTDSVPRTSGSTYFYVATAKNLFGESKPSNEAKAVIQ